MGFNSSGGGPSSGTSSAVVHSLPRLLDPSGYQLSRVVMQEKQILSPDLPGTIGFEIEQLFYHGKSVGISVEIRVVDNSKNEMTIHLPHDYFLQEQRDPEKCYQSSGAYGETIARSDLMEITLDTVVLNNKKHQAPRIFHVLEFVTMPYCLVGDLNSALVFCANTINDLYAYCKNKHVEKKILLEDWMRYYNQKEYSKHHPMNPFDKNKSLYLAPTSNTEGKTAHCLLNVAVDEIDPLMHIHTNVSVLMEQLFSMKMRQAFPVFTEYPDITDKAKQTSLKDWPSCRPNLDFEKWELSLTVNIDHTMDRFVRDHIKNVFPYSRDRIAGLLRTLIYCFCISLYTDSPLCNQHFQATKYDLRYRKDFYLHGIPKIHFDTLVIHGLIKEEQNSLLNIFNPLHEAYVKIIEDANLLSSSRAEMLIEEEAEFLSVATFIDAALIQPLHGTRTSIILGVDPLENTSPLLEIGNQCVLVPVLEFRAPIGNGCNLAALEALLTSQADLAMKFAQEGFRNKAILEAHAKNSLAAKHT